MTDELKLKNPWLVAVWPGMGNVALSAGYYLMAKFGMDLMAEFAAFDLFDLEHVEVKNGLIHSGRLPRSRLFVWNDPAGKRDIVVFIGEAQPPRGKTLFCHKLIEFAKQLGVERVFTFAAMATQMHPAQPSRVFGAATDEETLGELKRVDLEILDDGHIGGLNGVLLGIAAEAGLRGACLLGEIPHIFAHLPFPKASLAVLEAFRTIANIEIDLDELAQQARDMEEKLGELMVQVERALEAQMPAADEAIHHESPETEGVNSEDLRHVEDLFAQAGQDRSKAYELKRELDRLGVFRDFENRFLDLFKKAE
jgi:proteasome assembly chaperone (PAC2) family protein